jgi:hypothetical protein
MHIEPTKPATEQWLYEQCLEDPRAAADEIASLMWNHAKALDEIVLLRAEVARLKEAKSPGATLLGAPSEAAENLHGEFARAV